MTDIQFFRKDGTNFINIEPDAQSDQQKQLMQQDLLSITFNASFIIDFQIGDYCSVWQTLTYTINQLPICAKTSSKNFKYTVSAEGEMYDLGKVSLLFLDENNNFTQGTFSIMGNAAKIADLILLNLNRRYPGQWSIGTVLDTDYQNISFANTNCLAALGQIVSTWQSLNLEFFFVGKQINIYKRQENSGLSFQYGKGNGLKSITRNNKDSSNVVTRLYAFGGTQNIPTTYRDGSPNLLLPNAYYIEQNVDLYGVIEGVFSDDTIFPNRIGSVTSVTDPLNFADATLDFNVLDCLFPGGATKAKIKFITGQLAGYTFDVNDYVPATQTFTINVNTDEKAFVIPSDVLSPAVGDQYIIIDIIMPQSYVDSAEQKLLTAATAYLALNSSPRIAYTAEADPLFFKANNISLTLGFNVHIIDTQLQLDAQIRINSYTRNLRNPFAYTFTLDETPSTSIVTRILAQQQALTNVIAYNKLSDPYKARFNWKSEQELVSTIFDPEGSYYTQKIKPLFVETAGILIGTKSQQLTFDGVIFNPNENGNAASFSNTAGVVNNLTILSSGIQSWNVSAGEYLNLEDGKPYFVYVKANRNGIDSTIFLSQSSIVYDSLPGFYYFYVGFLASPINGVRAFAPSYGFTAINGRFITTGRIQSQAGSTYFDLDAGEIGGKVVFTNGSSGYQNLSDKPDLSIYAQQNYVNEVTANIQSQIDGQVIQYFYAYDPTLSNEPASEWNTNDIKNAHLDDLFYNIVNGYAYRFTFVSGVYAWTRIMDTDIITALANAAKAQDTADDKRRVFLVQPYTPYDIGDLWSQGNAGDLKRCIVARQTGVFVATDFDLASKYTDDTAVINLKIGGRNLLRDSDFETGLIGIYYYTNPAAIVLASQTNAMSAKNGSRIFYIDGSGDIYANLSNTLVNLTIGETYTLSYWSKFNSLGAVSSSSYFYDGTNYISLPINTIPEQWFLNSYTFTATTTQISFLRFGFISTAYTWFAIDSIKIEVGNKATDWTEAPEDTDTKISAAQQAAINSQASADAANAILTSYASDNIISPIEKKTVKKDISDIETEFPIIVSQAAPYAVDVSYYEASYYALIAYISDILADTTVSTTIDSATFLSYFSSYYYNRTNVLKAISDDTKITLTSAQAAANTAQSAANNSQYSANSANAVLSQIASDNVLSPPEKSQVLLQSNQINTEASPNINQAVNYGIDYSAYQNSIVALNVYLTPLLANLTTYTNIIGVDFRSYFANVYTSRSNLLKAISDAAKILSNNAQSTANGAQGSANNAQASANAAQLAATNAAYAASAAQNSANSANQQLSNIASDNVLSAGEKGQVLLDVSAIQGEYANDLSQAALYGVASSSYSGAYNYLIAYITLLIADLTVDSAINGSDFRFYFLNYYNNRSALLAAIATAAQSLAATAQANATNALANANNALNVANNVAQVTTFLSATTIVGNVVATGALLVGDATHNNAGITGVTDQGDSSVRFYAGTTYVNKNTASFRVLDNGNLYASNAFVSGVINAVSGQIGNWTIDSQGLINTGGQNSGINLSQSDGNGNIRQTFIGVRSDVDTTFIARFISSIPNSHTNGALYLEAANGTQAVPDTYSNTGSVALRTKGEVQFLPPNNLVQYFSVGDTGGNLPDLHFLINGLPATGQLAATDLQANYSILVVEKSTGRMRLANFFTKTVNGYSLSY